MLKPCCSNTAIDAIAAYSRVSRPLPTSPPEAMEITSSKPIPPASRSLVDINSITSRMSAVMCAVSWTWNSGQRARMPRTNSAAITR